MKVLCINPHVTLRLKTGFRLWGFPIGFASVIASIKKAGHEVILLDIEGRRMLGVEVGIEGRQGVFKEPMREFARLAPQADAIMITGVIMGIRDMQSYIQELKRLAPDKPLIGGGPMADGDPEFILQHTLLDIAAYGEGELTAVELLKTLDAKGDLSQVKGIAYRDGNTIRKNPPRERILDLEQIPRPAYELFPMQQYIKDSATFQSLPMCASRGCPSSCNFCSNAMGKPVVRRDPEALVDEMAFLKKDYHIKWINFEDECLLLDKNWLQNFADAFRRKIGLRNLRWTCNGHVLGMDMKTLQLIKEAGCIGVQVYATSGSKKILQEMNRGFSREILSNAIRNIRRTHIGTQIHFIYGTPGETIETIKESAKLLLEHQCICVYHYFVPYPGTKAFNDLSAQGRLPDPISFLIEATRPDPFDWNRPNLTEIPDEDFYSTVLEINRVVDGNYQRKAARRTFLYFVQRGFVNWPLAEVEQVEEKVSLEDFEL